jgi:hypothetical protein
MARSPLFESESEYFLHVYETTIVSGLTENLLTAWEAGTNREASNSNSLTKHTHSNQIVIVSLCNKELLCSGDRMIT